MWIKILLFLGLAMIAVIGLRSPRGARHTALRRIALIVFVGLAGLSVLFPVIWNAAAQAVGVGRGTDLILYILIVAFLLYIETSYLRSRKLEDDITSLARRIALDEAHWGRLELEAGESGGPTAEAAIDRPIRGSSADRVPDARAT